MIGLHMLAPDDVNTRHNKTGRRLSTELLWIVQRRRLPLWWQTVCLRACAGITHTAIFLMFAYELPYSPLLTEGCIFTVFKNSY